MAKPQSLYTPTARVNEYVRAFPPSIARELPGCQVEARDYYGTVRGKVLSVTLSPSGFPSELILETRPGRAPVIFSLYSTREIHVLEP